MIRALLTALTATALAIATLASTGASFTSIQGNGGNSWTAKADWVPPSTSMTDPGPYLSGTEDLATTTSDSGSGVQSVTIQRSPAGAGTWSTACTSASSPWGCSFDTNTAGTPDGLYDFRSTATDNASNSATSTAVVNRRIDNTPPASVTMTDPGTPISGTKAFAGNATDTGGSGVESLKFQYRPTSGGVWLDACTDTSSPYGCSADTTALADDVYDFRALATDNAGNTTPSSTWTSRRVDNVAPTVTMNDPGQYLRATIALTASAADGGGIASVVIQRRAVGGGAWTNVCTTGVSPYTCSWVTTLGSPADGLYEFQAVATDNANRSTTSAIVTNRRLDNTLPASVTITNPGAAISGNKTLTGAGTDGGSGIETIELQYSPTGQNNWTTACSGTSSPTNCVWDSTTVTDGLYDFRTRATDRAGNATNSTTASPNSRVDNYFPTVSINDPGPVVSGTEIFSAVAADGGGIASVQLQYKPIASGTWTTLCTPTVAPYQCSIDTTLGADGLYDFRAIATDNASPAKVTTSTVITNRRVDNTDPTGVTFTNPGSPLKGTVAMAGAAADTGGSGIAMVEFQYFNGSTWVTMCSDTVTPFGCNADTTAIPDGSYSMRSFATDLGDNTTASTTITARVVDNTAPTATMNDPGYLSGTTELLTATATDGAGSGVTSVKIQYTTTGGSTWTDVCTDNVSPFQCTLNTTTLVNGGQYDLRAISTDGAAWSTTSAVVGPRTVDNSPPTIGFTAPASPLRGSVSLTSTPADSGSGVASVLYEYKLSSGSTWSTACTGASSPWSCSWNSTAVAENAYDLRATVTDAAGLQTTSAVSANRIVDNDTTPTGTNVQAPDGSGAVGRMQVNDLITFTWSEPIAPASILAGWNGASGVGVVVRVDTFGNLDRLSVWNSTDTVKTNITSDSATAGVALFGNYTGSGVKYNGTMTMSGSSVTIVMTSLRSGGIPPGAVTAQTMQWPTVAGATDLFGNPVTAATVTETGAVDQDF
jgi:chitinase